jgi:hypothetical protein
MLVPVDAPRDRIDDVLILTQTVPLPRVTDHRRIDADVLQSDKELFRFRNRHVIVILGA